MFPKISDEPEFREKRFVFEHRLQAGEMLSVRLRRFADRDNVQVLAIPAGGVPVGYAISRELRIPLDVIVVRKIQIPWNTEAGFGALSWDGTVELNEPLVRQLALSKDTIERSISQTRQNILERVGKFRGTRPFPELKQKTILLVDDGIASGFTMLVAAKSVRKRDPDEIVVAVPTASKRSLGILNPFVDEVMCLNIRSGPIFAVAEAYQRWWDISDDEVNEWLSKANRQR